MPTRVIRRMTRCLLGAAVAAGLVMATPGTSSAAPVVAPPGGYGFGQGYMATANTPDENNRELDAVAKTGASWLRVPVDWNAIEGTRGQYNWGYLDNLVNGARARGLQVLGAIGFTPPWARTEGLQLAFPSSPPRNPADFAAFCRAVVQRYGDRVSNWEIWNEPNLPIFFGFVDNKARRYTDVLKAAYPAIKSVQPGSTVIAAGLSRMLGADAPPAFLQQMYDAGAGGFFDAAAAHPYVFPGGLAADDERGWSDVGRMHGVMAAHGDGGKKIWMTEIGAPTSATPDGVTQQQQAQQILDVMAAAAATGYSGPAFIYSIRDGNTANRGDREANYGALLTTDWKPKYTASVLAK